MIHMKCQALFFLNIKKEMTNLSSAAVVIALLGLKTKTKWQIHMYSIDKIRKIQKRKSVDQDEMFFLYSVSTLFSHFSLLSVIQAGLIFVLFHSIHIVIF